jgi:glycosyltransferase involved in cell wall biosynthesis
MRKLMIVIHSLRGGGSERVLINLLKGLHRSEFSITLVLYEGVFDYPVPGDVKLRILNIATGRNIFKLTASFFLKILRLAGLMRKENPDVIFSLISSTNATVTIARLLSGIKCRLIVSEHTHPSVNLGNELYGNVTKRFIKRCYPRTDRIVAVSEGIKQDLIYNFGIREAKIDVIYNPINIKEIEMLSTADVEHPWFHEGIPIIISVGRLTKQKGYPYLLKAFSVVRKSLECRLVILGEGEDREKLVKTSIELGLKNDVEFMGFQQNPFKYMARSSVFVLSSLYEGFGNVIVEAMALGLPVISTDCPSGPSEIIEDRMNGLLVPVKDENALARAILEVAGNGMLRNELSAGARRRAQSFTLDNIVEKYRGVFLENSPDHL